MKTRGNVKALIGILTAFCVILAVSLFFFFRNHDLDRRILYFPSYDSDKICSEVRYLPKITVRGNEATFVDELLLGPMTNRYKRIFPSGVKADFCFVKDDVLYVGLNSDALFAADELSVAESVELLRLNIVKNFTYLNKIDVSIDGQSVFEK